MIIFNELQEKVDQIHYFVRLIFDFKEYSWDTYDTTAEKNFYPGFQSLYHSLLNLFGYDASQVIAILNSLDFNDKELQYWLSQEQGFSWIVQQLPTFSQKFLVIEHFRELRKSFPDKGFNEDLDYVINLAEEHAGYFS